MKTRKIFAFLLALIVFACVISGCGNDGGSKDDENTSASFETSPEGFTYDVSTQPTTTPNLPVTKDDFCAALKTKYKEDFSPTGDIVVENDSYSLPVTSKSLGKAIMTASFDKKDTTKIKDDFYAAKISQDKTGTLNSSNSINNSQIYIYYEYSGEKQPKDEKELLSLSKSSQYNILYVLDSSTDFESVIDQIITDNENYSKSRNVSFGFVNVLVTNEYKKVIDNINVLSNKYRLLNPLFTDEYNAGQKAAFVIVDGKLASNKNEILKQYKGSKGLEYSAMEIL